MLTLLVPGVLMGASPVGAAPGGADRLLPLVGVGRAWLLPFLMLIGGSRG